MKKILEYKNYQFYLKENNSGHKIIVIFDDFEMLGYFWLSKDGEPYSLAIINACDFQIENIIEIKNNTNWLEII